MVGKETAIQKAIRTQYDTYFAKAVVARAWFPKRLKERDELRRYREVAAQLISEIREMLFGFLGVESFVDDYVFAGIQGAGDSITIREATIGWGVEERKHGQTFRYSLVDSGLATQAEVDKFLEEASEDTWVFERQTGHAATPYNASAYGIVQERQTKHNYHRFRQFLKAEYERTKNPLLLVLSMMVWYVERDEGAHESNFREILRIYLRYRPDLAIEAMNQAFATYRMPEVRFPNKEQFEATVYSAGVFSLMDWGRSVLSPAIQSMGLKDRNAVRAAEVAVQELPENAVVVLPNKPLEGIPEGAEVYQLVSDGSFQLVAA